MGRAQGSPPLFCYAANGSTLRRYLHDKYANASHRKSIAHTSLGDAIAGRPDRYRQARWRRGSSCRRQPLSVCRVSRRACGSLTSLQVATARATPDIRSEPARPPESFIRTGTPTADRAPICIAEKSARTRSCGRPAVSIDHSTGQQYGFTGFDLSSPGPTTRRRSKTAKPKKYRRSDDKRISWDRWIPIRSA
jgi:hypothetical protein